MDEAPSGRKAGSAREPVHDRIYDRLKARLITGGFMPGRAVTLRGLAEELGVSLTPVRAALARLSAERALDTRASRRVSVPTMTPARFSELMTARQLLEPEAAARALPFITPDKLAEIRSYDIALESAIDRGDVESYMVNNHAFHFALYSAGSSSSVLLPLIEMLWMQFGPFMRVVYGRLGTTSLVDQHREALAAMEARDEAALRAAISADIGDGMSLIGTGILEEAPPKRK